MRVAVCGGSGYAGAELLRLLAHHPGVEVTAVTSEKSSGKRLTDVFPHLHHYGNLAFGSLDVERIVSRSDVIFTALPHAAAQNPVASFLGKKKKVIDLSADYRLRDPKVYEEWYKVPHGHQGLLKKAVYGLPELHRKKIAKADLVANPGCYPTGAILGLYPAIREGFVRPETIVIDSKSGTSGAGRQSDVMFSYCEVNEGFKAYGLVRHRHTPEIEQEVSGIAGKKIVVTFTPHLVPLDRGILTTIYARLAKRIDPRRLLDTYREVYAKEPFVRVLDEGRFPNVKNVRGTNHCEIGIALNTRTDTLIVVTAIDNLVKGASGQAVQNMNIMMGFAEKTAIDSIALFP